MADDALLRFWEDDAITTTAKSDIINLHQAGRTPKPMNLEIIVTETFTAAGAATAQFDLSFSENADHSSPEDAVVSISKGKADLTSGTVISVPVERFDAQYGAIDVTVGTGPFTAGKVTARLVSASRKTALNS